MGPPPELANALLSIATPIGVENLEVDGGPFTNPEEDLTPAILEGVLEVPGAVGIRVRTWAHDSVTTTSPAPSKVIKKGSHSPVARVDTAHTVAPLVVLGATCPGRSHWSLTLQGRAGEVPPRQ